MLHQPQEVQDMSKREFYLVVSLLVIIALEFIYIGVTVANILS